MFLIKKTCTGSKYLISEIPFRVILKHFQHIRLLFLKKIELLHLSYNITNKGDHEFLKHLHNKELNKH